MNFLIITFDFPPNVGGVETRIQYYIQNLIKLNHRVTVIALAPIHEIHVENYLGATVYRCPSSLKFLFQVFLTVSRITRKDFIDIIHVLTGANTLLGSFSLMYGKIKGVRTGIFLYGRDVLRSKNNPLQASLLQLVLLLVDKIGVNSKATSKLLPRRVMHKVHILYPGVDVDILKKYEWRIVSGKERKILFVGRLIKRKGLDDLLQAFKLVLNKVPDAKLIIIGDGPEMANLCDLIKKLELQNKVDLKGTLVGKELYTKYQECDVFVMPSKKIEGDVEGFGIVFLEAGFFRKPSVGTQSGGIPEAVLDGQTGILVSEGNVKALADALVLLLNDRTLAQRYGRNARKRVITNFTWKAATLKLLKMYQ